MSLFELILCAQLGKNIRGAKITTGSQILHHLLYAQKEIISQTD